MSDVAAADLLTWLLLGLQAAITAACGVLLTRRHKRDIAQLYRSIHRTALALLLAAALPVSHPA
ncbi:hypothetical protein [Streptomyces sp. KHY 26]|uniref:hypothetical protein n=1 Tax=Streptomyces sp. KHY 26 TaxID=3097359 RepID=UPI00376F314E